MHKATYNQTAGPKEPFGAMEIASGNLINSMYKYIAINILNEKVYQVSEDAENEHYELAKDSIRSW